MGPKPSVQKNIKPSNPISLPVLLNCCLKKSTDASLWPSDAPVSFFPTTGIATQAGNPTYT